METLADFKRTAIVGTQWRCYNHMLEKDLGVKEVVEVKTKEIALKREDGTITWLDYPKARDCEIDGNSLTLYVDGELVMSYILVEPEPAAPSIEVGSRVRVSDGEEEPDVKFIRKHTAWGQHNYDATVKAIEEDGSLLVEPDGMSTTCLGFIVDPEVYTVTLIEVEPEQEELPIEPEGEGVGGVVIDPAEGTVTPITAAKAKDEPEVVGVTPGVVGKTPLTGDRIHATDGTPGGTFEGTVLGVSATGDEFVCLSDETGPAGPVGRTAFVKVHEIKVIEPEGTVEGEAAEGTALETVADSTTAELDEGQQEKVEEVEDAIVLVKAGDNLVHGDEVKGSLVVQLADLYGLPLGVYREWVEREDEIAIGTEFDTGDTGDYAMVLVEALADMIQARGLAPIWKAEDEQQ